MGTPFASCSTSHVDLGAYQPEQPLRTHAPALARCLLDRQRPSMSYGGSWRPRPPADLQAHYRDVLEATAPFRGHAPSVWAGYSGPWLENRWIERFCCDRPIGDFGGDLVPIFVQWYDLLFSGSAATGGGEDYPPSLRETLQSILLPDVLYVTVSTHDCGIVGCFATRGLPPFMMSNVLVLSAGGYGHVPLPLLKREMAPATNIPPAAQQRYTASFVPTLSMRPVRSAALRALRQLEANHSMPQGRSGAIVGGSGSTEAFRRSGRSAEAARALQHPFRLLEYHGPDWAAHLTSARVAIVPRGMGRSAYLLYEAMQLGVVPVYVHGLELPSIWLAPFGAVAPWLPYARGWESIAYSTDVAGLPALAARIATPEGAAEVDARRRRLSALRGTHLTYDGVLGQVGLWMASNGELSDLECRTFPSSGTERLCAFTTRRYNRTLGFDLKAATDHEGYHAAGYYQSRGAAASWQAGTIDSERPRGGTSLVGLEVSRVARSFHALPAGGHPALSSLVPPSAWATAPLVGSGFLRHGVGLLEGDRVVAIDGEVLHSVDQARGLVEGDAWGDGDHGDEREVHVVKLC